jgi:N-acyl-D-aspartate/D-glutamate deacylase
MGNCGIGFAPCREADREFMMELMTLAEGIPYDSLDLGMGDWGFETYPQYLDLIERRGVAINIASQVGHHAIKVWVMGPEAQDRFADATEMRAQAELLRDALRAGAAGFSIYNGPAHFGPGGKPVPSRLTTYDQFRQLLQVLADEGKGGIDVNWGPAFNIRTIPELSAEFGVRVNRPQTHTGRQPYTQRNLDASAAFKAGATDWNVQFGIMANSFEVGLEDPFMFAIDQPIGTRRGKPLYDLFHPLTAMTVAERLQTYLQPEFRRQFEMQTDRDDWNSQYWPLIYVSYSPTRPELEGKFLVDLARQQGVSPAALMLDLSIESDLQARFVIENPQDEDELDRMLRDDAFRIGASDAGAHQGQLADYRYPTHFLGHWVREKDFPLERAIQSMTSLPASSYGIKDRGTLRPGYAADITIHDPATVASGPLQRVNDLPGGARRLFSDGEGIDYVIVNGTVLLDHGTQALTPDALSGAVLRDFAARS